jgi:hypothetical protein
MKTPRNRVITFRVTESEYARLKDTCVENERRISEAARNAVLGLGDSREPTGSVGVQLSSLDEKLDRVIGLIAALGLIEPGSRETGS